MSFVEKRLIGAICCDKPGCPERIDGTWSDAITAPAYFENYAAQMGWTFWVGRSRRSYCSEHTPTKPRKMWQDAPLKQMGGEL